MPRLRRAVARRRRREAPGRDRDAAAAGARREGERARQAQAPRRLAAEDRSQRRLSGGRAGARPRQPADPALLAGRPRPVHHAAGGDHEGSAHGHAQRGHVPHAEDRRADDLHALADPQGRRRRLARDGRPPRRRRGTGARSGDGLLGERAAAEDDRRVHARGLPARRPGRARPRQDRRPRGAGERGDRPRGIHREGRARDRRAVRRPHGLLLAAGAVSRLSPDLHDDASRRDLPVHRRRRSAGRGRVARQGDRAHLPSRDQDDRPGDRRLRLAGGRGLPQLRHRLDPQGVSRARSEGHARDLGARHAQPLEGGRRGRRVRGRARLRAGVLPRLRERRPEARRSARRRAARPARPCGRRALLRRQAGPRRNPQVGERGRASVARADYDER